MDIRPRNKVNASFSMSSMTDLVFLLLIFFIILSTLVSPYALPVDLPSGSNRTSEKPSVSVTIMKNADFYINSQRVSEEQLETVLMQQFAENDENKSIALHVDKTVPTGETVKVLEIAKRNKCKIALVTKAN